MGVHRDNQMSGLDVWQAAGVLSACQDFTISESLIFIELSACMLHVDPVDVAAYIEVRGALTGGR